ncbi:MAG: response regulator, partial [Bdellovibrionota bacterium]
MDDEPELREVLRLMVQKFVPVASVDEAGDGMEALSRLEAKPYQFLILDMKMPKLDGAGVVK